MSLEIPKFPEYDEKNKFGILPRHTNTWIDDTYITNCYECGNVFNWWLNNRKHHCRGCGRIFCSNCLSYNISCTSQCININKLINPDQYIEENIKLFPESESLNLSVINIIKGNIKIKSLFTFNEIRVNNKACLKCLNSYNNLKNMSKI